MFDFCERRVNRQVSCFVTHLFPFGLGSGQFLRENVVMELNYPADAEAFRGEIREWLVANLPAGWGTPGFELTAPL